jgi:FtsP/CotA-like multicopper oxidase with cupredoxin domain
VVTPNGWTLPYKVVDGVKVFHLIAEPVRNEFAPGLVGECWGYNGTTPGPTIEVVEGDRVRIYVTNRLPEPTSVHWHGILLPNGMDGVSGLTQKPIAPGETCTYAFTLRQHGTHMYHPHFDEMTQMALGMQGLFIIHPRTPARRPDRDFALLLNEWRITPGTSRPNPNEMLDFNVFTMNSKAFPGTAPLVAKLGDRVKIRLVNLSATDHHPIHLHGHQFRISETDGGPIPMSAQQVETTVLVPVGSARAFEFVADVPGDWALHCHMTHHTMNQMGHDIPNMVGVQPGNLDAKVQRLLPTYMTMGNTGMGDMASMSMPVPKNSIPMRGSQGPFGPIDMGGMFTVLKVRRDVATYDDPGWYVHPPETVAATANAEDLRRDGIVVPTPAPPPVSSPGHQGHH